MGQREFAQLFAVFFAGIFRQRGKRIISRFIVRRWINLACIFRWWRWKGVILRIVVREWFVLACVLWQQWGKRSILRIVVRRRVSLDYLFRRRGRRKPVQSTAKCRLRKTALRIDSDTASCIHPDKKTSERLRHLPRVTHFPAS